MVQYTVAIRIHPERVDALNLNRSSLCIARVVKDAAGVEHCNVIATTRSTIQPNMEFTWDDEYKILGANIKFQEGVKISGFSDGHKIEMGQMYTIKGWTQESVSKDTSVPSDTFGFSNEILCSPLLLMKIDNGFQPIYISAAERGEGTTMITPLPKVQIWFQDAAVSSTMSTKYKSKSWPVDLVPNGKAWAQYDNNGKFTNYTPPN